MPGYSVSGGDLFVSFGNYADISSHTPAPDCPMPESEKLSNYIMRLLATMEMGGWRLVQRSADADKETAWKSWNALDGAETQLGALNGYISYMGDKVALMQSDLALVVSHLSDIHIGIDDTSAEIGAYNAAWVIKAAEILLQLVEIVEMLLAIKDAIDGAGGEIDMDGLIGTLNSIFKVASQSVFVREKDSAFESVPEEILGELEEINDNEDVFEIGDQSFYLKSKCVKF